MLLDGVNHVAILTKPRPAARRHRGRSERHPREVANSTNALLTAAMRAWRSDH